MKVRFDKLNRFETPLFILCNPGSVYANAGYADSGNVSNIIGILSNTSAEELILNFNSTSELNFRISNINHEASKNTTYLQDLYNSIQNHRLIFVSGIGYFVIKNVVDGFDNGLPYKDVKAESCEVELKNKILPYIENNTYQFMSLLNKIVDTIPNWAVGHVDDTISIKYRTFRGISEETNILAFMQENMQDAYECVFVFDIIHRLINVYDQSTFVTQTEIYLTKDDLINELNITEKADDLYTAIRVFGNDNLTIHAVNPLGTNIIYDFGYYLSWMSEGLRTKVTEWQKQIERIKDEYYSKSYQYYQYLQSCSTLEAEIRKLAIQVSLYMECYNNIMNSSDDEDYEALIEEYNKSLEEHDGEKIVIYDEIQDTATEVNNMYLAAWQEYSAQKEALKELEQEKNACEDEINTLRQSVSFQTYFTANEYAELSNYIYEGVYTDEYIITTDTMSYTDKFSQMKLLYDRAMNQLQSISRPLQEFSIGVESFVFVNEFERISAQLETGCLINIKLTEDDVAALFLSSITINYDDKSLSLSFGNRFNKSDYRTLFDKTLGNIEKTSNSINYIKGLLSPITSGQLNEMQEAIDNIFDYIYPVGTVYLASSPKQPEPVSVLGVWEKVNSNIEGIHCWKRIE